MYAQRDNSTGQEELAKKRRTNETLKAIEQHQSTVISCLTQWARYRDYVPKDQGEARNNEKAQQQALDSLLEARQREEDLFQALLGDEACTCGAWQIMPHPNPLPHTQYLSCTKCGQRAKRNLKSKRITKGWSNG